MCKVSQPISNFYGEAYICKPCNNVRCRDHYRRTRGQKIKERMPLMMTEKMARAILGYITLDKKGFRRFYSTPNTLIDKLERFLEFYEKR